MYLYRPCASKKLYYPRYRRAAYDRVVYQHNSLSADSRFYRIKLYAHSFFTVCLRGLYKRSADILVFNESEPVRYTRLMGISYSGVNSGIRYADYNVGVYGMLERKERACPLTRHMHGASIDNAVGTSKINMLENTQRRFAANAIIFYATQPVCIGYDNFARFYVAHKLCAGRIERAAFGCKNITVVELPYAKRSKSDWVSYRDKLLRRHYYERICTLKAPHGAANSLFY